MTKRKTRLAGHAAHTKDAQTNTMTGSVQRPIKLTMLGAGSGFTPRLVNDVLRIPNNQGGVIALVDVDLKRLRTMHRLIEKLIAILGVGGKSKVGSWRVVSSSDRTNVLKGSDYVVNCIEVSGTECVRFDNDIPLKYGIDQCIGDTTGPGGLFKSLRTIPVWLDVLRDCERLCPRALVLNYTNPMAMMCLAAGRSSSMEVVGLCHSVQGTSHQLAKYADIPYEEMDWECAGINHLAWFTKLEHKGVDLYASRLYKKFSADLSEAERERGAGITSHDDADYKWTGENARLYKQADLVRKDMCLHFGAFITESSGHLSEYLPYYRKSDAGRALLRQCYDGGSRFYASNWPNWRKAADKLRMEMLSGEQAIDWKRSWEYASWIVEAREKDTPFRIHGNVMNNHKGDGRLITNLPADGCVEVACMVDGNGINPTRYGSLPPQMAAVCSSNMGVFDLGVTAATERSVEAAIHALLLDPLTSAVLTPSEIKAMTLEMFKAEKLFLPGYR